MIHSDSIDAFNNHKGGKKCSREESNKQLKETNTPVSHRIVFTPGTHADITRCDSGVGENCNFLAEGKNKKRGKKREMEEIMLISAKLIPAIYVFTIRTSFARRMSDS